MKLLFSLLDCLRKRLHEVTEKISRSIKAKAWGDNPLIVFTLYRHVDDEILHLIESSFEKMDMEKARCRACGSVIKDSYMSKLLHLFLNHPDKYYYIEERLLDKVRPYFVKLLDSVT